MINNSIQNKQLSLSLISSKIELVLEDEGPTSLTLVLPAIDDFLEMKALEKTHFSLKQFTEQKVRQQEGEFQTAFTRLEKKYDQFKRSPVYLTRLANLADMAGLGEKGQRYLESAKEFSDDLFFDYRLGENLITAGKLEEAESIFSSLNLETDIYANLRMSFFEVQRTQFEKAKVYIDKALSIDYLNSAANMVAGALAIVNCEFEQAIRYFRVAEGDRPSSSVIKTNKAIAYLYLQNYSKALVELKKAVSINPLNKNALTMLADVAYAEKCDEDAIPSLRFFLKFEQQYSDVWGRLARSHLRLDNTKEAIDALKHQGSLEDGADVWNNLGVAYFRQQQLPKAAESFSYILQKEEVGSKPYLLAARNFASLLINREDYKKVRDFTETVIQSDSKGLILHNSTLSDIWAMHLAALWSLGEFDSSVSLTTELLSRQVIPLRLQIWLVTALLSHLALSPNGLSPALKVIESYANLESNLDLNDEELRDRYINNAAFVYAEAGQIENAEQLLKKISNDIHVESYPTATLGLINMRKGYLEKAKLLYEEAIHLATKKNDKVRIRQKLNFEMAKLFLNDGTSKSRRYLEKVVDQSDGSQELVAHAKHLLTGLPF